MKNSRGPMTFDMRALALLGARARIAELDHARADLDRERDTIVSMFPELGKQRRSSPKETGPSILFDARADAEPERNPASTKQAVLEMLAAGKKAREIAASVGLSVNWIHRIASKSRAKSKSKTKSKTDTSKSETSAGSRGAPGSHDKWRERRHFDDAFKTEAVRRVKIGEGMRAVAEDIDVSQSVLSRWVAAAGFGAEKKTPETKSTKTIANKSVAKPKHSPEQRETALARIKAGESQKAVADSLGVPVQTVGGWNRGKGGKMYGTKTKRA